MSSNIEKYEKDLNKVTATSRTLHKKFHITLYELAFLVSFVVNFVVGKLIHYFSEKEEVYNFYNNKRNFINQIFVKKGWGWTTLVIAIFYVGLLSRGTHPAVASRQSKVRAVSVALFRYAVVTVWWVLFTQWCFGLPLMDKIFVWTGGKCTAIAPEMLVKHLAGKSSSIFKVVAAGVDGVAAGPTAYESNQITSHACRRLKGSWEGGHDPSGHVFLLVHSSLYLFFETLPFWSWAVVRHNSRTLATDFARPGRRYAAVAAYLRATPHVLVVGLVCLWWFMLFMTNIYFHSIAEKFVGLLFGYVASLGLYYAPRWFGIARH